MPIPVPLHGHARIANSEYVPKEAEQSAETHDDGAIGLYRARSQDSYMLENEPNPMVIVKFSA